MKSSDMKLSDGRNLNLLLGEGESQTAVIFHHGTPSCANIWKSWIEKLEKAGIRAVAYSRAGYYTSDRKPGRNVVDVNADISEVLDRYDIKSFISVGWSGGGPHALASSLDSRCKSVVVLAGVGMYGQPDLDFLAGMGEENIDEFGTALQGEIALSTWMEANGTGYKTITGAELRSTVSSLFSKSDVVTMQNEKFSEDLAENFRQSLASGFWGWMDDDFAFTQDWGFSLDQVKVPVTIFQGDEDLMVPGAHGRWLHAKMPHSTLRLIAGEGHLAYFSSAQDEVLDYLLKPLGEAKVHTVCCPSTIP
ncbi:MAG TPA: alpha/beta fold hydrolase [Candidatus Nanopelagicaceae bacterium]|nr:alpha/beta fold hydrolase [Candidatus Nanopelagicaceae bacterium]